MGLAVELKAGHIGFLCVVCASGIQGVRRRETRVNSCTATITSLCTGLGSTGGVPLQPAQRTDARRWVDDQPPSLRPLLCRALTVSELPEGAVAQVPAGVQEVVHEFWLCSNPECGKLYWQAG